MRVGGDVRVVDFEQTVADHANRLFALAYSILRDPDEAEDAVQAATENAWRKWGALRSTEARGGWLRTICVRECVKRRRRRARDLGDELRDTTAAGPMSSLDIDLERAIRALTSKQRAVVTLHYGHGYSLDECADLMGTSPGTTRSHLNRALSSMRKELTLA